MAGSGEGGKRESPDDDRGNGSSVRDDPDEEKEEQGRSGGVGIWWKNLTSRRKLRMAGDDDDDDDDHDDDDDNDNDDDTDVPPLSEISPAMAACEGKKESPAAADDTDVPSLSESSASMAACEGKNESPAADDKIVVCDPDDDEEDRSGIGIWWKNFTSARKRSTGDGDGDGSSPSALQFIADSSAVPGMGGGGLLSAIDVLRDRTSARNLERHGIVDVMKLYPSWTVFQSVYVLAKLQMVWSLNGDGNGNGDEDNDNDDDDYDDDDDAVPDPDLDSQGGPTSVQAGGGGRAVALSPPGSTDPPPPAAAEGSRPRPKPPSSSSSSPPGGKKPLSDELIFDLARYSSYASAAYGWKLQLVVSGNAHRGSNLRALVSKTGLTERDVVAHRFDSDAHRPAWYLVRDHDCRSIVLCVRGTATVRDVLTNLSFEGDHALRGEEDDYETFAAKAGEGQRAAGGDSEMRGNNVRAHGGMVSSARFIAKETRLMVEDEMSTHEGYRLVLCGHSMGGGAAAILGTFWRDVFPPNRVVVYVFGCPCVSPLNSSPTGSDNVYSVMREGDPFSALSVGHVADISRSVARLCKDDDLRRGAMSRLKRRRAKDLPPEDVEWCRQTMSEIREKDFKAEKFYPSGQLLYISGTSSEVYDVRLIRSFFCFVSDPEELPRTLPTEPILGTPPPSLITNIVVVIF